MTCIKHKWVEQTCSECGLHIKFCPCGRVAVKKGKCEKCQKNK